MKPVNLKLVRDKKRAAKVKEVRDAAVARVKDCTGLANEITGYAMIFWDKGGNTYSVVRPGAPIAGRLVPVMVHDVLQQHASSDIAEQEIKNMLWPTS